MIPEPRNVTTIPTAMPAISDPAPRPRIPKRTICCQSMWRKSPRPGGAAFAAPPTREEVSVELEGGRRPEEAGDALELAGALVLEELRLVVARRRLRRVLGAVEARRTERLRALEGAHLRREVGRGDLVPADLVHQLHRGQDLAPGDDHPGVCGELGLADCCQAAEERRHPRVAGVEAERRGDPVDPLR